MSITVDRTVLSAEQKVFLKDALLGYLASTTENGLRCEVFYDEILKKKSDDLRMRILPLYMAFNGDIFPTNYATLAMEGIPAGIVRWFTRLISVREVKVVLAALEGAVKRMETNPEIKHPATQEDLYALIGIFSPSAAEIH